MSNKIALPPLHILPEIEFKVQKEVWNIYQLEDDSLLFFKIVAVKFLKLVTGILLQDYRIFY